MRLYNIEIFDRQLNYVCNNIATDIKFKSDYMDPEKYKIELEGVVADKGYFIHFQSLTEDYIGIISAIEQKKEGITTLTVTEIPNIFDLEILIDVNDFNYTLEEYIKKQIKALFIDGDSQMALPFNISINSTTTDWIIDYKVENEPKEDEEEPPVKVAFINLFDDLILPAFTSYQVKLDYSIDLLNKKINIDICKNTADSFVIEAELPNILDKSIIIRKNKKQVNKITVYDENDYSNYIVYYLYSDDSFGTVDTDRQLPVNYKLLTAKEKVTKDKDTKEEVVEQTFEEAALAKATDTFNKNKYTNLIELEMCIDDELIRPTSLKIGQVVSVLTENGTAYSTILSGYEISNTITLIFGTVRLELTKQLKGRS